MFGLGKNRTKVKKTLDKHRKNQQWLCEAADINKDTATKLCTNDNYIPSRKIERRVLNALKLLESESKREDFWT